MGGRDTLVARAPLLVAVGGGKGGVGKSVIALNLAVAMAKLGARVTAVDADLGSANLHTMLGLDHPGLTLQALLDGHVESLAELSLPTKIPNLSLIAGSVAVPGAANLHHARKTKLLRHISKLDADVVVLDCGAGVHFNVVDFFAIADLHLLVANAQLVSLQNAYGFLKACLYRMLQRQAQAAGKGALLEQASDRSELETVPRLLERVASQDPALALELRAALERSKFALLGNQLVDAREQQALHALSRMIGDFLGVQVPVLGGLLRRDRIHAAVTQRRPFILDAGDPESLLLMQIAEAFLTERQRAAAPPVPSAAQGGSRLDPFGLAAAPYALPLTATNPGEARAHERYSVDWAVTIEVGRFRQAGRILEISRDGMKLELRRSCPAGAHLRVVLPQESGLGLFSARVVHVSDFIAGCMFDPKPSKFAISGLIERAKAEAGSSNAIQAPPSLSKLERTR
jgi:flagellar biosynthesis protein FlhG